VIPLNVTKDLESDLIGGLLGCDLDQANVVPNFLRLEVYECSC
jgi:hypothetical protein